MYTEGLIPTCNAGRYLSTCGLDSCTRKLGQQCTQSWAVSVLYPPPLV